MIGVFAFFISVVAFLGVFMYVIIMGPSRYHRDGLVGKVYRLLLKIPTGCGILCCTVCSGCNRRKGEKRWRRCGSHILNERNWFMVVFYILLVWTVEFLYLVQALPGLRASWLSKGVSWGLVLAAEFLYGMAVFADPGRITMREEQDAQREQFANITAAAVSRKSMSGRRGPRKIASQSMREAGGLHASAARAAPRRFTFSFEDEQALNRRYVVDGMLYALAGDEAVRCEPEAVREYRDERGVKVGLGQECTTCHIARPSRSKHCRLCGYCVRRYDHHCPWINNDVAEGTQRYFLGFLLVHALSCTWACWDLYRLIRQFFVSNRAWGWQLVRWNGQVIPLSFSHYVVITVNYRPLAGCLLFFAVCIGLVLYGFWLYQMSFAAVNLTINDMNKIDDVVGFVVELPSLDLVYREAQRVCERLDHMALTKPRALHRLVEPPLPMTARGYEEGGKKNLEYRAQVKRMLLADLKHMFNKGFWHNMKDIFFPYAALSRNRAAEAET